MIKGLAILASVATLTCFGVLIGMTLTVIAPAAGGLMPLDLRFGGYTPVDVHTYLQALSEDGRALYSSLFRTVDTVFPVVLTITLMSLIWVVAPSWSPPSKMLLVCPAFGLLVFGLYENILLDEIVAAGPSNLNPKTIFLVSKYTVTKYVIFAVVVGEFLVLAFHAWRGAMAAKG